MRDGKHPAHPKILIDKMTRVRVGKAELGIWGEGPSQADSLGPCHKQVQIQALSEPPLPPWEAGGPEEEQMEFQIEFFGLGLPGGTEPPQMPSLEGH